MSSFANAIKAEISRVARKHIRSELTVVKKAAAQYRKRIADLNRQNQELNRRVASLERRQTQDDTPAATQNKSDEKIRFSPKMIAAHRRKLGLSAADYAKLAGVSSLTVYKWEQGKTKPRPRQLNDWSAIRHIGKREAKKRLQASGE